MKTMKHSSKLLAVIGVLLSLALIFTLASCGGKTTPAATDGSTPTDGVLASKATIGVLQYAQHPSLDNCREGFIEGLKQAGLTEGTDFEISYENAGADDALDQQIAANFSAKNVNLMCGIATPSAMACFAAAEEKDIPVIFCAVSDPAAVNLTEGNVTGTSDKLPVEAQLQLIRALQPEAKTIGIVYTLSELNSVSTIEDYKAMAPEYGFTIEATGVSSKEEIPLAVDALIAKEVDCFSNLTDNNVVDVLSSILEKTDEAGIPVYGSEIEQVKNGCVACAGIDYFALGVTTGQMAAKVLKGEATCEEIPFETISEFAQYFNFEALNALNITVPDDVAAKGIDVANAE